MKALSNAIACALVLLVSAARADEQPIAIAEIKHEGPVHFEKEVLPLLTKNCTACHNAKKAESELVLETPATILKGGASGPAVMPGKSAESLLLKAAAHVEEPYMPPDGNEVGAVAFTSEQLGLLKLWIDEGAKGEVSGTGAAIQWQPLPSGSNPILAVALTPDGQVAACGRANQIFIYNVASGAAVTRLTDPALVKSGLYQTRGVAHLDLVQSLAFSPDGDLLASGSYREVKLWRRPHNVRRAELVGGTAATNAVAVSPDGKWAATGDASGQIKLWDTATFKDPKVLAGHTGAVTSLRFLPSGATLVSGSLDKTIRTWNVADGAAVLQFETPQPVAALAVLVDGAQLASGGGDNVVRLWTLPTEAGKPLEAAGDLAGHTGPVAALAGVPTDKGQVVSASADGTIRIWSTAEKKELRQINHGAAVTALSVRNDGAQLASAGADNLIKLWKLADGQPWAATDKQPIAELKGDARAEFHAAQLERVTAAVTARLADTKQAAIDAEAKIVSTSGTVTSTQAGKEAAAKALAEKKEALKAPTDAKAAADKELAGASEAAKATVDKAAQAKAAAEKDAGNAELAKANEEAKKAAEEVDKKLKEAEKKVADAAAPLAKAMQELTTAEAGVMAADQAAQAAVVAVKKAVTDVPLAEQTQKDAEAALVKSQAELEAAKQATAATIKPVRALAYSADGTQLASAGDNQLVRLWNSDNGLPIDSFDAHQGPALAVAFLTDGAVLSGGADNGAFVWESAPGWLLERTIGNVDDPAAFVDRVIALAFSHDGRLLATGGGEPSRSGELKILNVADGALVRQLPEAHSDTIFGLEFSPDDAHIASSAADRFVKVFNVATGAPERSFEGHTHHVLDVAWQWDGKVLASCGADNVIKVWDFVTGDQRRTTPAFGKEVTSLSFIAAQPKMLAASGDKTVRVLNADNGNTERSLSGPTDFMYSVAITADGKVAVAGGQDSVLYVWLVDNGQLLNSFPAPKPEEQKPAPAQTAGG